MLTFLMTQSLWTCLTDKIITTTSTHEELIKKSLFISVCGHVTSTDDFFHFLEQHQDLTATHNCWAYKIGNQYRFNDDGEPSGTAGKPILAAIEGAGFDFLGALIIRYYGGIKLGTGGLARAYGGTTARNLQLTNFTHYIPTREFKVQLPFEFNQPLFNLTTDYDAKIIQQEFNEKGVQCKISIPQTKLKPFKESLKNTTKGQVEFIEI